MKNFDQWAEDLAEHIRKKEEKKIEDQKELKIVSGTISGIINGKWDKILNSEIQNCPFN